MALTPAQWALVESGIINARIVDALTPSEDDGSWKVWEGGGSTAIQNFKHLSKQDFLTVRFKNKPLYPDYLFIGVPIGLYEQWRRVQSKGKFYHRRIKGQYSATVGRRSRLRRRPKR